MELKSLTVVALKEMAKSEGIKGYSKMNKEQLVEMLNDYYRQVAYEEQQMAYYDSIENTDMQEVAIEVADDDEDTEPTNSTIKMFDIKRYAEFVPYENMKFKAVTANQINLANSLENNFKVSIDTNVANAYEMSMKLSKVYKAILSGKVQYRSEFEISERVKTYKAAKVTNKATQAQLSYISKLEKETGKLNTRVISSVEIANEVIRELLELKNSNANSEVAVTSVVEDKLKDHNFRTKFVAMMKKIFA